MRALLVPPHEVPSIWLDVAPLIDKALAHSVEQTDSKDMLRPIINGACFLWIVINDTNDIVSVCFGEFTEYPSTKGFHIHGWATKSGHQFDEVIETFENSVVNFAKINGCDFIEAKVRKGLTKKLKWDWKHSYLTLKLQEDKTMGGRNTTTHHTVEKDNPYDDAWIRSQFDRHAQRGLEFSNWQAGRQASLQNEAQQRQQLQDLTQQLRSQQQGAASDIANLQQGIGAAGAGISGLQASFAGMSAAQQQQMKNLYNLANKKGTGVYGVQTPQGVTFTKKGTTAGRQSLTTSALNP